QTLLEDSVDGCAHEERLIGKLLHVQVGGHGGEHAGHGRFDLADDVQGGGGAAFQDRDQCSALAVHSHDVCLRVEAVAHLRHVVQVDGGTIDDLDRQIVEILHHPRAGVHFDIIFRAANL